MEKQTIKFELAIKAIAILSLALIAFSAAFYFVIFLPQKEQTRMEEQRQEQRENELQAEVVKQEKLKQEQDEQAKIEQNKKLYKACLIDVVSQYNIELQTWAEFTKNTCDKAVYISNASNCYQKVNDALEEAKKDNEKDKDDCWKLYPQQ